MPLQPTSSPVIGKNLALKVQGALLFQHFHGSLGRVQHYDMLTQNFKMRDITCMHDVKICVVSEGNSVIGIRHICDISNERPSQRTWGVWCMISLGEHLLHQIHCGASQTYAEPSR